MSPVHDMGYRIGYQCERCTDFMTYIRKEVQSFLIHPLSFVLHTEPVHIMSIREHDRPYKQYDKRDGECKKYLLVIISGKVTVHLMMECIQMPGLPGYVFRLHRHDFHICLRHQRCFQHIFFLIMLPIENLQCQFCHTLALSRIDIGGSKYALSHHLNTTVRSGQAIYSAESRSFTKVAELIGSQSHTVILPEYIIYLMIGRRILCAECFHHTGSTLSGPVAVKTSQQMNTGILPDGIHETSMALNGRRRTFQSHNLHHITMSSLLLCYMTAHRLAYRIIISSD